VSLARTALREKKGRTTLQKKFRKSPLYLWYVAVPFLYRREFSLIVLPWTKGNNMEIILSSCDTNHSYRDLNLQPIDPCSGTLAFTPKKLLKIEVIVEVF
jgi:hypothetical protein